MFPNVLLDVTGTSASLTSLFPIDPSTTVVVAEYLFAADDVRSADFDPTPVVEFSELVGRQDYEVCERVQRGVASTSVHDRASSPTRTSSSLNSSRTTAATFAAARVTTINQGEHT